MTTALFPYETPRSDLTITPDVLTVDGKPPAMDVILSGTRTIDLSVLQPTNWRAVEINFNVSGQADEILQLEQRNGQAEAGLVAMCGPTNMRQVVQLKRSSSEAARWYGALRLDRRNFAGKLTIDAILAAQALGRPHRFMARSSPWTVYVDEPDIPIIEGTLRVRWADFTSTEVQPTFLHKYENEVYFADLEDTTPTLYLNSGFKGLPELLSDRRTRPPAEEALHQSERMSIASRVWLGMFNAAVAAIEVDDEDGSVDWPLTGWLKSVLQTLLPRLYPEMGELERLTTVRENWLDADGAKSLESVVQIEIARQLAMATTLRRTLERMQRLESAE
jgi:hypothetical protein